MGFSLYDITDHNPSSTTAQGSFHGTGISLFQFPTSTNVGEKQDDICLPTPDTQKNHQLLDSFTTVDQAMPVDQAHEQNNEHVKGSGGAVGLAEIPSAFRTWMVSGP